MNNTKGVILLVEDNREILDANRRILEEEGYRVLCAGSLAQTREHLEKENPGVAVLDIMLPDGDGVDFLVELRQIRNIPVLFLTGKAEKEERLKGLRAGGNDYITKPYDIDEFRARVETAFSYEMSKRGEMQETITKGALTLRNTSDKAYVNGVDLSLSHTEYKLLWIFVQNEGKNFSPEELYEKAWGQPMCGNTQALRSAVKRLRRKLKDCGYTITTDYGVGFKFEVYL